MCEQRVCVCVPRLSSLHSVLEDVRSNARVFCCSQVVPVMIRYIRLLHCQCFNEYYLYVFVIMCVTFHSVFASFHVINLMTVAKVNKIKVITDMCTQNLKSPWCLKFNLKK